MRLRHSLRPAWFPTLITSAWVFAGCFPVWLVSGCTSDLSATLADDPVDDDVPRPDGGGMPADDDDTDDDNPPDDDVPDDDAPAADAGSMPDGGAPPPVVVDDAGADAGPSVPDLCGNSALDPGEECDEGAGSATCDRDCTFAFCGDGFRNAAAGEQCDEGGQTSVCNLDCTRFLCPSGCECLFSEGSAYMLCDDALAQSAAAQRCELDFDGHLAQVETGSEQDFLLAHAQNQTLWIGATDADQEGTWVWPSGEVFWEGAADGMASGFEVWGSGQPNDLNSDEDCLVLRGEAVDGSWNDATCSSQQGFLCEREWIAPATCGDGVKDDAEFCDTGDASETCDADCTVPHCGDGVLNEAAGEGCDDNNEHDFDACDSRCRPTGLVAYWPLMEAAGEVYRDRISGLDLTPVGFTIPDSPSGYVLFDGTTNLLELPEMNPPELGFADQVTFAARVQFDDVPDGLRPLVVHGDSAAETHTGLWMDGVQLLGGLVEVTTDGVREETLGLDVSQWVDDGVWHDLALTLDDQQWTLYIDGIQINIRTMPQGFEPFAAGWALGGFPGGAGDKFVGKLRDVRIFSRGLSQDQVTLLSELP